MNEFMINELMWFLAGAMSLYNLHTLVSIARQMKQRKERI